LEDAQLVAQIAGAYQSEAGVGGPLVKPSTSSSAASIKSSNSSLRA
jgi:hypothetical protein